MTRIDFHFNTPARLHYGCRLVRKVWRAGLRTVVFAEDRARLDEFDRLLWSFEPETFVPHVHAHDPLAAETPVLLASGPVESFAHHEVLVNLGDTMPPFFSRFDRLVEVVSADPDDRARARERYRFYRERGYPIESFDRAAPDEARR